MDHDLDEISTEMLVLLHSAERLNVWPLLNLDFSESGGLSIAEGRDELIAVLNSISTPNGAILRGIELLQETKLPLSLLKELSLAVSEAASELDTPEPAHRGKAKFEFVSRSQDSLSPTAAADKGD